MEMLLTGRRPCRCDTHSILIEAVTKDGKTKIKAFGPPTRKLQEYMGMPPKVVTVSHSILPKMKHKGDPMSNMKRRLVSPLDISQISKVSESFESSQRHQALTERSNLPPVEESKIVP